MIYARRPIRHALTGLLLGTATWVLAPTTEAQCSCMCVDEVAYNVCLMSYYTSQSLTAECTAELQCPVLPPEPEEPVEPEVSGPLEPAPDGIECSMRQVYRPDHGRYQPQMVCMPAAVAVAHESLRTKRAEMASRYQQRQEASNGATHKGQGPHQR
jgi:hypothetical protein